MFKVKALMLNFCYYFMYRPIFIVKDVKLKRKNFFKTAKRKTCLTFLCTHHLDHLMLLF